MGDDENVINLDHYEKQEQIGSVQYGDVFKVKKKSNGKYFAAKILKICINDDEYQRKKFERDLRCYQTLDNPAVVKFIGYSFESSDIPVIITKYMTNGCLSRVFWSLRKRKTPKGWNNTKMIINILGISLGMKYLHDCGIIHRDLKPSNVLLDENYYPKLTDFGIRIYKEEIIRDMKIIYDSPQYNDPEINIDDSCRYKVDVFSFGIVLFFLFAEKKPFNSSNADEIKNSIAMGIRPEIPQTIPKEWKLLIEKCWNQNPIQRPTFTEICKILESPEFVNKRIDIKSFYFYRDEFLDKHSNEMSKININSLYNIFNHKERKLTNHDLAYRFITENNGQFLILLQSIDGSKLSFNFYRDAIDKQNEHYDFIPINITSHIDDCNKEHQKMKEIINELQEKFEEDKRKSSTKHKKELNMLKEQQQKQLEELEEMHKRETEEIRNEIKMMKEEQQQKFEEAEERHKKEIDEMKDEIIK